MNRREVHYHIRRLPTCVVVVASVPGELEVELVPHVVHHSAIGMEFGYAGGGPADLALSLLTFHLEANPRDVKELVAGWKQAGQVGETVVRVVALYQRFKDHALAGHGDDALDLTGAGINRWIELTEREMAVVRYI
jgi:hypothetical protein